MTEPNPAERRDKLAKLSKEPGKKVVAKLKTWRKKNDLSPRQVAALLEKEGSSVSRRTLEAWLGGYSLPSLYSAQSLEALMAKYPVVTDAPQFGRWPKPLSAEQVTEIHRLRKQDMTLLSIAEKLGVSESTVSRICSGNRRAK